MRVEELAKCFSHDIERRKALGFDRWEQALEEAIADGDAHALAAMVGCSYEAADGRAVFSLEWDEGEAARADERLNAEAASESAVDGMRAECALDRAYFDLVERDRGLGDLPEWVWRTLVDEGFRQRSLADLGDVGVAAMSPNYWGRLFYVYRDVEAYLSGLGRSSWFDADWAYWYTL